MSCTGPDPTLTGDKALSVFCTGPDPTLTGDKALSVSCTGPDPTLTGDDSEKCPLQSTNSIAVSQEEIYIYICVCPWSTKAVISSTAIFVAIDNNTLYGSKLYIFLL